MENVSRSYRYLITSQSGFHCDCGTTEKQGRESISKTTVPFLILPKWIEPIESMDIWVAL
jgi:hypothetical protein